MFTSDFLLFTYVNPCLLVFTYVYHLLSFNFTYIDPCLLVFTYVYACSPMFSPIYSCLHMFATV